MKITILLSLTCALVFGSCTKDRTKIDDGTFEGVFKVSYSSGDAAGPVTLVLKNGRYDCIGNSDRYPPNCKGTFNNNDEQITFKSEGAYTADFDWNLILKGEYDYTYNGKNLYIYAAKNDVGFYALILEKK